MRPATRLTRTALACLLLAIPAAAQTSPFEMVRWKKDIPEVKVGGTWYGLKSIDKVQTAKIIAHAKKTYEGIWAKRFCEDLVDVMNGMGHRLGNNVRLELADLKTGKVKVLKKVAMTRANRQAIWRASPRPAGAGGRRAPRALGGLFGAGRGGGGDGRNLSPFSMVRFVGETPQVQVDGEWYGLYAIDKTTTRDLLRFCKRRYGTRWAERFCEDLTPAFAEMGRPLGNTARLELVDLKKRTTVIKDSVPLTRDNRQAIKRAEPFEDIEPRRSRRVQKNGGRGRGDRSRFGFLTRRHHGSRGTQLDAEQAEQDLDQLELLIEERFSYRTRKNVDYRKALDTIRAALGDGIARDDFHIQLRQLVALFGDGHARVRGVAGRLPRGYAPFRAAGLGDRVVALAAGTGSGAATLLDPKHPYLTAIDGKPLNKCLAAAARLNADGSPQFVRRVAIESLAFITWLRQVLGVKTTGKVTGKVTVTLQSANGKSKTEVQLPIAQRPSFAPERPQEFRMLQGDIAYLRLDQMRSGKTFEKFLHDAMQKTRKARGLILDIRGNGGGSRVALRTLFPYLMKPDDAPQVGNIATYLLQPEDPIDRTEGYLQNRFLYPKTSKRWRPKDLAAITAATPRFKPRWTPRGGNSSPLHFMLLRASKDTRVYHFDRPVVLLIDSGCFSATDIFAGAFKGWRNVTLVGTPTGGGSGRSETHVLKHSGLRVKLSTMVSYQPDGQLYDSVGVTPDVVVAATLSDLLGKSDSVLDRGKAVITNR